MPVAARAGVMPSEFWAMTLRDALTVIEGFVFQAEAEYNRAVSAAWLTAALSRQKRLPRLQSLLKSKPPAVKPLAEREAKARALAAELAPGMEIIGEVRNG